jgi:hypothetical protein
MSASLSRFDQRVTARTIAVSAGGENSWKSCCRRKSADYPGAVPLIEQMPKPTRTPIHITQCGIFPSNLLEWLLLVTSFRQVSLVLL